jgi:hypothetical protein
MLGEPEIWYWLVRGDVDRYLDRDYLRERLVSRYGWKKWAADVYTAVME